MRTILERAIRHFSDLPTQTSFKPLKWVCCTIHLLPLPLLLLLLLFCLFFSRTKGYAGNEPWDFDADFYRTILEGMLSGFKDGDSKMKRMPGAFQVFTGKLI